jgi:hypothetical protein
MDELELEKVVRHLATVLEKERRDFMSSRVVTCRRRREHMYGMNPTERMHARRRNRTPQGDWVVNEDMVVLDAKSDWGLVSLPETS